MDEHGKSALAVLELSHVTRRIAGDSPSVLSHHGVDSLLSLLTVVLVWMLTYLVTPVLGYNFSLLSPSPPLCELGYPTPLRGGWMLR